MSGTGRLSVALRVAVFPVYIAWYRFLKNVMQASCLKYDDFVWRAIWLFRVSKLPGTTNGLFYWAVSGLGIPCRARLGLHAGAASRAWSKLGLRVRPRYFPATPAAPAILFPRQLDRDCKSLVPLVVL